MFSIFKRKQVKFFSDEEEASIVEAIQLAEKRTSGEIRVHIESKCRFVDPLDRAEEIFSGLKMEETQLRNAVLVYVAMQDRQLAIYADKGIFEKAGAEFWHKEAGMMLQQFNKNNYAKGIIQVIHEIGEALSSFFPYDEKIDKNELPDQIAFGR